MPRLLCLLRRPTMVAALVALVAVGLMGCAPPQATSQSSMIFQVNVQRAGSGLPPLAWCPALGRASIAHSDDQAVHNTMTHTGSDGSDLSTRMARAGYNGWNTIGENVAAGYPSDSAVLYAWMMSPGHAANILNPSYTHMGSGYAYSRDGTRYWTQDFGSGGTC